MDIHSEDPLPPTWGPSLSHPPGAAVAHNSGDTSHIVLQVNGTPGVVLRLGSQCQQISRRAESDTFLSSRQTIGTFPGSSGEGVACKRIPSGCSVGWLGQVSAFAADCLIRHLHNALC